MERKTVIIISGTGQRNVVVRTYGDGEKLCLADVEDVKSMLLSAGHKVHTRLEAESYSRDDYDTGEKWCEGFARFSYESVRDRWPYYYAHMVSLGPWQERWQNMGRKG